MLASYVQLLFWHLPVPLLAAQSSLICLPSRRNISSWTQKCQPPSMDNAGEVKLELASWDHFFFFQFFAIWASAAIMQLTVDTLSEVSVQLQVKFYTQPSQSATQMYFPILDMCHFNPICIFLCFFIRPQLFMRQHLGL